MASSAHGTSPGGRFRSVHERQCEVDLHVYQRHHTGYARAETGWLFHSDRIYSGEEAEAWFDVV